MRGAFCDGTDEPDTGGGAGGCNTFPDPADGLADGGASNASAGDPDAGSADAAAESDASGPDASGVTLYARRVWACQCGFCISPGEMCALRRAGKGLGGP